MYGNLEYCFQKDFFLARAVSMYGLQHSEFVLGKKNSYPEQFLCIVYEIPCSAFRKKTISSFSPMHYCVGIVEIFPGSGVPNLRTPPSHIL